MRRVSSTTSLSRSSQLGSPLIKSPSSGSLCDLNVSGVKLNAVSNDAPLPIPPEFSEQFEIASYVPITNIVKCEYMHGFPQDIITKDTDDGKDLAVCLAVLDEHQKKEADHDIVNEDERFERLAHVVRRKKKNTDKHI